MIAVMPPSSKVQPRLPIDEGGQLQMRHGSDPKTSLELREKAAFNAARRIPKGSPGYFDAQFFIGMHYIKKHKTKLSIRHLREVPPSHPFYLKVCYPLGKYYLKRGENYRAQLYFAQVSDLPPDQITPKMRFDIGSLNWKMGVDELAKKHLKSVPEGTKPYAEAQFYLALCYLGREKYGKAQEILLKISELQPRFFDAQIAMGLMLHLQGRNSEASVYLEKIPLAYQKYQFAQFLRGCCQYELKDYSSAAQHFSIISARDACYLEANRMLRVCQEALSKSTRT